LTVLMTFIVSFYLQIILYFTLFAGPSPYNAIANNQLFLRGRIYEKNDQMLILEKKACSAEDCKLLGDKEFKLQRSSQDAGFQVGDVVIVQLGPPAVLENPPPSTLQPGNLDSRIYAVNDMMPNRFDPLSVDRGHIISLIMLLVCITSVVGGIYWWWGLILTKKKSER
jgi:hypothetical protein